MERTPDGDDGSERFRIGKLFHLTPLVDSIGDAEFFFNSVFSPLCMMRNYSPHWHRHGAVYVIAETSIEPMQPLPPRDGEAATSWFRYMEKHGPHVHNMAFYVENAPALAARLAEAGVRTTNGGTRETVFTHPKDTPGMLEFQEAAGEFRTDLQDPRFSEHWPRFRDDFWATRHPLGLERMSHITLVVHDVTAATRFYTDVLAAVALEDQASSVADAEASFVMLGEDTVLELVHPSDPSSVLARELETVGQCVTGVTFTVRDVHKLANRFELLGVPVLSVGEHEVLFDRARTWNTDYRFTDRTLAGDPRAAHSAQV